MVPESERALQTLYQAPLDQFVTERTRLAAALRAAGDKTAAADLAKRRRPPISAWAVNQVYWHARDAFDRLLAAAARLRSGDLEATREHREALHAARKRAATLLEKAGHNASDDTLRRVTTTLTALAAAGGFAPDPPGALVADREAPGFDALVLPSGHFARAKPGPAPRAVPSRPDPDAARRAAEVEERRRRQEEAAQRRAERHRVETKLRTARTDLDRRERTLAAAQKELRDAERALAHTQRAIEELERELDALKKDDED